jgi:hypothetical protein
MSSHPQRHAEYVWSWGRRWKVALTTAALMVLVTSVIRLIQGLMTQAGSSTSVVKLTPGLSVTPPFVIHFGWDFATVVAWSIILVLLMTGPTSEQSSADECVDTMTLSIVLGVVSGLMAAFVGLCAILVAGFLCGCLRSGSVRRSTFVGNVFLAPAYGSLVVGLVVVTLVGFAAGAISAEIFLSAHLVATGLAFAFGMFFPVKDGRTRAQRLRERFQSWVISHGFTPAPPDYRRSQEDIE